MSSRDYIMGRIRWSLGRGSMERDSCESLMDRVASPKANLIPKRGQGTHKQQVSLFVKMAKEVQTTVSRLKSMDNVPRAVKKYLKDNDLAEQVRLAPHDDLKSMDWAGMETHTGPSAGDDLVCVVRGYAGVAETGSLALMAGPEGPTTLNFLPDYHIVVIKTGDIVGDYEAVYGRMRHEKNHDGFMPRALNWVCGPSRTADIEQTLLLGAHGPRSLHILLVDDHGEED